MQEQCTTPEVWRPVKGYEGRYEVSDQGRVRSFFSDYSRNIRRHLPRLLSSKTDRYGYRQVGFYDHGRRRCHTVHSLVLTAFIGPRPDGFECAHWDGDPSNNVLPNLRWVLPAENAGDKHRHGTTMRGAYHPQAKLSEDNVRSIRSLYSTGRHSQRELASFYDVSRWEIRSILSRRTWALVPTHKPEVSP